LHHAFVLSEIFMALEEILVCVAVATLHCAFARPLFGADDVEVTGDFTDRCNSLPNVPRQC
jgi:hypothetical protein